MHLPSSTKLFNKPSRLVTALESLSLVSTLIILLIWMNFIVLGVTTTSVDCQMSDASPCSQETQSATLKLLGQRSFFTSLQAQSVSTTATLSQKVLNYTFSTPTSLTIIVEKTPPVYYCQTPQGVFAVSSQGNLQPITTIGVGQSELPTLIIDSEELATSLILSPSSEPYFQLHPEITALLATLKSVNLDVFTLRLQDGKSASIALGDNLQVLIDLNRLSAISNIPAITSAPEWQLETGQQYQLDLRFQYPLLRKIN